MNNMECERTSPIVVPNRYSIYTILGTVVTSKTKPIAGGLFILELSKNAALLAKNNSKSYQEDVL